MRSRSICLNLNPGPERTAKKLPGPLRRPETRPVDPQASRLGSPPTITGTSGMGYSAAMAAAPAKAAAAPTRRVMRMLANSQRRRVPTIERAHARPPALSGSGLCYRALPNDCTRLAARRRTAAADRVSPARSSPANAFASCRYDAAFPPVCHLSMGGRCGQLRGTEVAFVSTRSPAIMGRMTEESGYRESTLPASSERY